MYQNILVPIDGSATSTRAVDEAVKLARLTQGRLRLLHILDPLGYVNGFETPALYWKELQPAMMKAAEQLLDEAKAKVPADVAAETAVQVSRGKRVSEIIVDEAASSGADLIVLGTHGRRGIERVMMGSDAEQVARTASVPVLLVRHAGEAGSP